MGYRNLVVSGDTGSINGLGLTVYANNAANHAGSSVLFANSGTTSTLTVTDANLNTLIGSTAGNGSITGTFNTGLGYKSLNSLQSGNYNIGIGYNSGGSLTTAQSNIAIGYNSLNTATGAVGPNIAIGTNAASLQTSAQNISIGYEAGYQNSSGNLNTAVGDQALYAGLSATQNSCFGYQTGNALTSGSYNTFIGLRSGALLLTGIENTGLGYATCAAYTTSESNNICIGYNVQGTVGESNVTRIGNGSTAACYITGTLTLDTALTLANGGTGATTLTQNGVLYGNGTSAIKATTQLNAGQTLIAPTSTSAPTPTFSTNQYMSYVPAFNSIPNMSLSTGGAAINSATAINIMSCVPYGVTFEVYNGSGSNWTHIAPTLSTTASFGWNINNIPAANSRTMEITEGNSINTKNSFTIGTSPAFFVKASFAISVLADIAELSLGFRIVQTYQTTYLTGYTDYACISINTGTGSGAVVLQTQKTSGGETLTNTTNTVTAATLFTFEVDISGSGVVTYKLNGSAPTTVASYTFTSGLQVIPWITYSTASGANAETDWASYQCGLQ